MEDRASPSDPVQESIRLRHEAAQTRAQIGKAMHALVAMRASLRGPKPARAPIDESCEPTLRGSMESSGGISGNLAEMRAAPERFQ
jgi:hypothetical protein